MTWEAKRCSDATPNRALLVAWIMGMMFVAAGEAFVISPLSFASTTKQNVFPRLWQKYLSQPEENPNVVPIAIPYIIEQLGDNPPDRVFDDVADMCINVFFNKSNNNSPPLPWTLLQLKYLSFLQAGDLRRRSNSSPRLAMFVARRVIPMESPKAAQSYPLILDLDRIENMNVLETSATAMGARDYVRGEIIGFCEVSERAYGLGDIPGAGLGKKAIPNGRPNPKRPFLTNLCVTREARKSGIGSQLVQACETAVRNWGGEEIVLEVEADNVGVLTFYEKRGYNQVFSDPTGRRFNTEGFILSKERCVKVCMRKIFDRSSPSQLESNLKKSTKSAFDDVTKFFQGLRENVVA